jgi:hypothetical protein
MPKNSVFLRRVEKVGLGKVLVQIVERLGICDNGWDDGTDLSTGSLQGSAFYEQFC